MVISVSVQPVRECITCFWWFSKISANERRHYILSLNIRLRPMRENVTDENGCCYIWCIFNRAHGLYSLKKMLSYRYRNLHHKPEMVSRPSQVYNGNPSTNKTVFLENKGLVQHDEGYSSTRMMVEHRLDFKLTKDPHVFHGWVMGCLLGGLWRTGCVINGLKCMSTGIKGSDLK